MTSPRTTATAREHTAIARRLAGIAMFRTGARIARDRRGFTLIETLVAILTGVIVTGATFSILDISLRQSSRIADRVSANQRGRIAMEKVQLELHSSCVSVSVNPIQTGSTGANIKFLSQRGSEPYFTSMTKHEIFLSGGTLKDASYQSNGGTEGKWKFPEAPTITTTLLTGVTAPSKGTMFEYFKYKGASLATQLPASPSLTEAEAKSATKINVNFTVAPETGNVKDDRQIELSDSAVLRLTPSTSVGGNEPCE
jgi:type II secretory pathway pseudopilin PulG